MPNHKVLQVIWRPEDAHEVFERAATFQTERGIPDDDIEREAKP